MRNQRYISHVQTKLRSRGGKMKTKTIATTFATASVLAVLAGCGSAVQAAPADPEGPCRANIARVVEATYQATVDPNAPTEISNDPSLCAGLSKSRMHEIAAPIIASYSSAILVDALSDAFGGTS